MLFLILEIRENGELHESRDILKEPKKEQWQNVSWLQDKNSFQYRAVLKL